MSKLHKGTLVYFKDEEDIFVVCITSWRRYIDYFSGTVVFTKSIDSESNGEWYPGYFASEWCKESFKVILNEDYADLLSGGGGEDLQLTEFEVK